MAQRPCLKNEHRVPIGYVLSRFPQIYETFITREVQALNEAYGSDLPIFSLKPHHDWTISDQTAPFVRTTNYPSTWPALRALPTLFSSKSARACLNQVLEAHHEPRARAKALATLLLAAAMIPEIRRLNLRHVHAHWATMPALAAYFINQRTGIPYSITAHAADIYAPNGMIAQKLKAAQFVVTCTIANVEALVRLGAARERVFLCYHGLDLDRLPAPLFCRKEGLRILAVGRMVEKKGFKYLVKACHLLSRRNIPFTCRIIGDGPFARSLQQLVNKFRLAKEVSLSSTCSHEMLLREYRSATLLCVPSIIAADGDRDGIPNVILEAMSQGLPVVASKVSGIPEVVKAHKTGWLVPPGDSACLTRAFEQVRNGPDEAVNCARAAYSLVRRQFDIRRNIDILIRLFAHPRSTRTIQSDDSQ